MSAPPGDVYDNQRTAGARARLTRTHVAAPASGVHLLTPPPHCCAHAAVPTAQLADNLAGSLQLDAQPQAQLQRHAPQPPPPGGYYAAAPWGAAAGPPPHPHQQQLPGYYSNNNNNRQAAYQGTQGQGWYQQQQHSSGPRVSACTRQDWACSISAAVLLAAWQQAYPPMPASIPTRHTQAGRGLAGLLEATTDLWPLLACPAGVPL